MVSWKRSTLLISEVSAEGAHYQSSVLMLQKLYGSSPHALISTEVRNSETEELISPRGHMGNPRKHKLRNDIMVPTISIVNVPCPTACGSRAEPGSTTRAPPLQKGRETPTLVFHSSRKKTAWGDFKFSGPREAGFCVYRAQGSTRRLVRPSLAEQNWRSSSALGPGPPPRHPGYGNA